MADSAAEARVDQDADRDRRMAERQARLEQERAAEAEIRAASGHAAQAPKKRRGPADNMDPDIDL